MFYAERLSALHLPLLTLPATGTARALRNEIIKLAFVYKIKLNRKPMLDVIAPTQSRGQP
jgi:hypothetical protein